MSNIPNNVRNNKIVANLPQVLEAAERNFDIFRGKIAFPQCFPGLLWALVPVWDSI